eukprot:6914089-Alexandrium_andersonii.AAC.1
MDSPRLGNLRKSRAPPSRGGRRSRRASRGASGARICVLGVLRVSADFEARRMRFGPSGELGPRPPKLDVGARAN